ncbi:MAG: trehalose synthase [Bryobacteraceae bacterium]|nr:trehalose synthase [Bryobacteraceae bacterium]
MDSFADGNGDGVGDFEGLTSRLDYLAGLNVNCVWLQPFFPSPNRDNGYDMDYYGVNPLLGTLGDFVEFLYKARERGIRVIVDLVVNHTSNDHPWFQEARQDPDSHYRGYFVVDALPFLIELKGIPNTEDQDPYQYLSEMRQFLSWHLGDAVLMAEANLPPEEVPHYFHEGNRIHVVFNFWVNQHMFLALAREDGTPIRKAFDELPGIPSHCQWANFLRTHDELDLGRLSDAEREEVFQAFGPEKNMRLYDRGIRRRLAPMLNNDRKRLELAHSLILTLPGTPVLRYGDEIGMGDDLSLKERESVRTPMQWSNTRNSGFSWAPEDKLVIPVIKTGEYSYKRVNVATQQRDPDSLVSWLERAMRLRRRCPEFGSGRWQWLETGEPAALAHCCQGEGSAVFAIHNLSSRELTVKVDLGRKQSAARPAGQPQHAC